MTEFQIEQASDRALAFETDRFLDETYGEPRPTPEDRADFLEDFQDD